MYAETTVFTLNNIYSFVEYKHFTIYYDNNDIYRVKTLDSLIELIDLRALANMNSAKLELLKNEENTMIYHQLPTP